MPCSCNRSIFSFAVVSDMQMNWVINSVKHVHLNILELCQVIPPPTPPLLNSKNSLPSTFLTCLLLEHHVPFLNLYIVSFQKYSLFARKMKTQLLISTFCKFHDYLVFLSSCISYFLLIYISLQ